MKVYFIFQIKDEFYNLYKDTPSILFQILKNIYYLDKEEVDYGYHLFRQLVKRIDKNSIDRELFIKYHQDIPYIKRGNIHIRNDLYRNEVSRLEVKNYYFKLEVEQNFSSFYKVLEEKLSNLFVCCFKNTDFFFLDDYYNTAY